MDNIKKFPQRDKTQEQKYHELLEENRELRKKLDALQSRQHARDEKQKRLEQIRKRLTVKTSSMNARAEIMKHVDTIDDYRALTDKDNFAELFGILKAVRWQLHAVTSDFNLSVIERRTGEGVSKGFASFSKKPSFLTLLRICLNRYSRSKLITTGALVKTAKKYDIRSTVVKNFLKQALAEKILIKPKKGIYKLSAQTKQDYWHNLLRMLFQKETIQLVAMLRRVYGMTDMALLQHGNPVESMRAFHFEETRPAHQSAYVEVIRDLI